MQERWLRHIGAIARTRAVYPIVTIALGACVFSGLMTFQMSLVQGTHAQASTFFSLYAMTVVTTRWLFSRLVVNVRRETAAKSLLVMMVLGIAAMFAVPYHVLFHSAAAVLLGTGYGLAYPIIETQAVNDSGAVHRRKGAFLTLIAVCGLAALMLAIVGDRRRIEALSAKA